MSIYYKNTSKFDKANIRLILNMLISCMNLVTFNSEDKIKLKYYKYFTFLKREIYKVLDEDDNIWYEDLKNSAYEETEPSRHIGEAYGKALKDIKKKKIENKNIMIGCKHRLKIKGILPFYENNEGTYCITKCQEPCKVKCASNGCDHYIISYRKKFDLFLCNECNTKMEKTW
jgi:hypothetical protein